MSTAIVEGNGAVTGHIISTTIGGKNGEPKRVGNWFSALCISGVVAPNANLD